MKSFQDLHYYENKFPLNLVQKYSIFLQPWQHSKKYLNWNLNTAQAKIKPEPIDLQSSKNKIWCVFIAPDIYTQFYQVDNINLLASLNTFSNA